MSLRNRSAFLVLILASTCLSQIQAAPNPPKPARTAARPGAIDMDRVPLFAKLNLTAAQKRQIQPILAKTSKRIGEIRANPNLSTKQKNQMLEAVHDYRSVLIQKVLTPGQAKQFHLAMLANNIRRNGMRRS